jgi:hypothetical protein
MEHSERGYDGNLERGEADTGKHAEQLPPETLSLRLLSKLLYSYLKRSLTNFIKLDIIIEHGAKIKHLEQKIEELEAEIQSINTKRSPVEEDNVIKDTGPRRKRVRFS